ncbi:MAG: zinc-binding dehydrogenase, partial [Streptomyces sp.]
DVEALAQAEFALAVGDGRPGDVQGEAHADLAGEVQALLADVGDDDVAGARNVVITDVSEERLDLARKTGATLALNVSGATIADGQRELGLREGFDVGLEMSGRPEALRDMIVNMTHGGRIAMLGLPAQEFPVDWARIVTKMITIKGIYGREMFETWYAMSVLLEGGLDLSSVITGRYAHGDFEAAFADAASGRGGKVILDWADSLDRTD